MWWHGNRPPQQAGKTLVTKWQRLGRYTLWTAALLLVAALTLLVTVDDEVQLVAPPATELFEDRHGNFLAESERGPLGFWDVTQTGRVATAILAIEDHRFYNHHGVDVRALARALWNNLRGGPREGGSTIAMQVARMQHPQPRTYYQKVREMVVARRLVGRFGHQAVLQHYLKIAPMGNRIHGVAYAARRYFDKPLADLSWAEAALLAALPKAPGDMNLYRPLGRQQARQRARLVLQLLRQQNVLHEDAYQIALTQLQALSFEKKAVRPFNSMHAILRLETMNDTRDQISRPRRTTLDLDLQEAVDQAAFDTMETLRPYGAGNIAVMVVNHKTGDILSYLGSDFYADSQHAGAIDYAQVPRSAGSTLKPFLYALGLEQGTFRPNAILPDVPLHLTFPGGHYAPSNYDLDYLGPLLYGRALANSRNIPAVWVLRELGLQTALDHLGRLQLTDETHRAPHYGLGLAIGGLYVTLEDLVRSYGSLASEGRRLQLRWFLDASAGPTTARIYRERTARQINRFLSDPQLRLPSFPRGSAMDSQLPIAIKTGTSQGFRDAWCIAYSRQYLVGVWVGRPDHGRTQSISGSSVTGLAVRVLEHLHPDAAKGIDQQPFPAPRDTKPVKVCALTGDRASPLCDAPLMVDLRSDQSPPHTTNAHVRMALDSRDGMPATARTPDAMRVWRTFHRLPAMYHAWMDIHGYQAPPAVAARQRARIQIVAPTDGARYRIDPNHPRAFQSLSLRATVYPEPPSIEWYINGERYQNAQPPYNTRWTLAPGIYQIQAAFPNAAIRSEPVTIQVTGAEETSPLAGDD